MSETRNLFIEFGAFDGGYSQDPSAIPVIDAANRLHEDLRSNFGNRVRLVLIPYEGVPGMLGGGRRSRATQRDILESIKDFNSAGMPFMLAMNGGLGVPLETEIDLKNYHFETERTLLAAMSESGEKNDVRNIVTVLNQRLIKSIKKQYPLDVVSSTISFVGGRKDVFNGKRTYDKAFEDADGVCPLNQHTTPDFLREWSNYAYKMVLLLNSHCDCPDMHKCYQHYLGYESPRLFDVLEIDNHDRGEVKRKDFVSINNPSFPYTPGCDETNRGQLSYRLDHLQEFMRWGVNRFKLGRNNFSDPLNISVMKIFVRMFLENPPKEKAA